MKFTTSQAARATNGSVFGPEIEFDGATQDSRAVVPGQLFVPLVAERDGHDFVQQAIDAGATAYLTHDVPRMGSAVIVENTTTALRDLASAARDRIGGPVVAITGSVGKTSTKDLLASVLHRSMKTHASVRSFNNEIGVPLTLLNTPDDTEVAVVEMGARGIGHIALLCEVARPTIGIVTIVAPAHTGEFGSVEAIAVAKGEIVEGLPSSGLAVLNGDNDLVRAMASRTEATVLTFGTTSDCDVAVTKIEVDHYLRATFEIATEWGRVMARPTTRGAHMATNVAAAVGTALWMGMPTEAVEAGLAEAELSPWRMDVQRSAAGALVINDTYNANPTSMRGALDGLSRLPQRRKIAVVGYMGELGDSEAADHLAIGQEIMAIGAELIAVGTDLYGVDPVGDPVETIGRLDDDTAILVKGSRSAGLETVAEALLAN